MYSVFGLDTKDGQIVARVHKLALESKAGRKTGADKDQETIRRQTTPTVHNNQQ